MFNKNFRFLSFMGLVFMVLLTVGVGQISAQDTCTASGLSWGSASTWSCSRVPTSTDNVVIPLNQQVIINVSTATAGSLTVNGTLTIGNNNNPRILDVEGDVSVGTTGLIEPGEFSLPQTHTFRIGGNVTNNGTIDGTPTAIGSVFNVVFDGASTQNLNGTNSVALNNLVISSSSTINIANLPTAEGTVTNAGTMSQSQNVSGFSEFLRIQNEAATNDAYLGVTITPSASLGQTTVAIKGNQVACTTNSSDALMTRCFTVTPTNPQNSTVRFYFTEGERNGQAANSALLWHWSTGWSQVGDNYTYSETGTTCSSAAFCWFQAENVSSFSPFGLGSGGAPTAVSLQTTDTAGSTPLALVAALVGLLGVTAASVFRRRLR